jgi:hypothetical protein
MAVTYKIHPAIGAARIGNSSEYYLAPETPGGLPLDRNTGQPIYSGPGLPPHTIYHDASGALKKQAARFKVFAYDNANPADLGTRVEVGATKVDGKTVTGIEWTVYLANKKAAWFQFQQLTGSGMEGDPGYNQNNAHNAMGNPLRFNKALGTTDDPATIDAANRRPLMLDPGPRTVAGPNAPAQEFNIASKGLRPFDITTLGRILTDGAGNLIVLGGNGCSGTTDTPVEITTYANNNGWFDDVSDGPVTAALVLEDGAKVAVDTPSWVICGPPKYAPELINLVSMYDTMYDIFVRQFGFAPSLYSNGFQAGYRPNRAGEIVPLLRRPNLYQYVAIIPPFARSTHAGLPTLTSDQFKQNVEGMLRGPDNKNSAGLMPYLAGDNPLSTLQVSNYLTLTATQFFILSQFANGIFSDAAPPAKGEGAALDQASLENCVGGAFCPGIEMTWICRNTTIYRPLPPNPSWSDAFRIRHKQLGAGGLSLTNGADNDYSAGLEPGDIIKYMAQPWQADFNECSTQPIPGPNGPSYWWWPVQRPYSVVPAAGPSQQLPWTRLTADDPDPNNVFPDLQMVTNWKDVGFILNIGTAASPRFVEIERNQKAISDYAPLTS